MEALKFACADFTFPLLSHDKVLELIRLLDFTGVDIGLFSGRSHLRPEIELTNAATCARQLKSRLVDKDLLPSDVYLQLSTSPFVYAINHPNVEQREFARDAFLRLLDYACELGADHITCLPGMPFPHEKKDEGLKRSYDELAWRLDKTKDLPVVFSVEPHIGSLYTSPQDTIELLKVVPGLTLTLDYTHFIYQGYSAYEVHPLALNTSHFHARGARKGRLQTSVADNVIDYGNVLVNLLSTGYSGWIGLEYIWTEWEKCNDVDNISETVLLQQLIWKSYTT